MSAALRPPARPAPSPSRPAARRGAAAISAGPAPIPTTGGSFGPGIYHLIPYTGSSPSGLSNVSTWTATGFANTYSFSSATAGLIDLIVNPGTGSAQWNFNNNGNYSAFAKWSPPQVP